MTRPPGAAGRRRPPTSRESEAHWSIAHFSRIIWHRKLLVVSTFVLISIGTAIYTSRLPNVYRSETVILVDPQKVPEAYVKSTVTGDVRNRLGTLSQQILSVTRLQKIVDSLNLYPAERKAMAREDLISLMRGHITVDVLSDFGAAMDLQAFRIAYSGSDPRLVAQVANQLASLFIEENLRAREQQANGTTEFLDNQLRETRKALEDQESRLRDFRLRHLGSMPEQEPATLQILGQLQSQLQNQNDALSRAEQQKTYLQSLMVSQSVPVVDMDTAESLARPKGSAPSAAVAPPKPTQLALMRDRLKVLSGRYSDVHPEVRRLRGQIKEEEEKMAVAQSNAPVVATAPPPTATAPPPATEAAARRPMTPPSRYVNPVLESQMRALDADIVKHNEEKQRISRLIGSYQGKLESIPVNEQQISALQRDYEISKTHYKGLLEKQLSAETATQLELRQKGEKFSVLDPAQPAERPSSPNRSLLNGAGCLAGLCLGLMLGLVTEFLGLTVTTADQIPATFGIPVLEVIPEIRTEVEIAVARRYMILAGGSAVLASIAAGAVFIAYRYN